jgi:DNA-binding NarL/FixJ family response regulator
LNLLVGVLICIVLISTAEIVASDTIHWMRHWDIMEARPDLKVVVCSGYSIDGPARKILDAGAEGFIQKPFLIAALAEKLKEVLEGK